jgi:SAM-dependent methyltransferase
MSDDTEPPSRPGGGYDDLAARSDALPPEASPWGDSHFQQYHSWPPTWDLCPVENGDRVLLAGCGRGDHVGAFLDAGASVVGVDASGAALEAARERTGDGATFHRADLRAGLPAVRTDAVDLVVSHLVASHLPDLGPFLADAARVLRPGGRVVCATIHPAYFRTKHGVEAYATRSALTVSWPDAEVTAHYRPTAEILTAFPEAGLSIVRVAEPTPRPAYADHAPERDAAARRSPQVLCLAAVPDADRGDTTRDGPEASPV